MIIAPGAEINFLSVKMKLNWTDPLRVGEAACHRGVGNLDVSFAPHSTVELCDDGGIHHASGKRDACGNQFRLAFEQFENLFRASVSQWVVVAGREIGLLRGIVDWRRIRQRKIGSKVNGGLCHRDIEAFHQVTPVRLTSPGQALVEEQNSLALRVLEGFQAHAQSNT